MKFLDKIIDVVYNFLEHQIKTNLTKKVSNDITKLTALKPVCLSCNTDMIQAGQAALKIFVNGTAPLIQYLCPKCGSTCRYLYTYDMGKESKNNVKTLCFWSNPDSRKEFSKRLDKFTVFKPPQTGYC